MEIFKIKISDLKSPEKNVRKHSQKQIAEFCRSLEKFGQIRPVVIDEINVVYCGNGLVEAAKTLGWKEVEAYRKTGMSAADKKKLMIADNRIYTLGFDDFENINAILEEIGDFDIPGFDTESLEAMFGDVEEELESFGILSEEEKSKIKSETDKKNEIDEKHYIQNNETEHSGKIETYNAEESQHGNEADEKEKLVCPECGHVFE